MAISSELALAGSATDLHYVAAKGAVLGLVKSLAMEVAADRHPGQRGGPGPDRHAPAGAGLALARSPTTWPRCRWAGW